MTRKRCEYCGQELPFELEDRNFRVSSVGWVKGIDPDGVEYLESPEKDAWEYLKCEKVPDELVGEQLFTWDSAIRRTKEAGKRIPSDEEFSRLLKTKDDMPNLMFVGYRGTDGSFASRGTIASIWLSLESGSDAWFRYLYSSYAAVSRNSGSKAFGFSVRCLKD